MLPPDPILTRARLVAGSPVAQLVAPPGGGWSSVEYIVRRLAVLPFWTLTVTATAAAPVVGTPPWPATLTLRVWFWPRVAHVVPGQIPVREPERVSRMRAGLRGVYWPWLPEAAVGATPV